MKLSFNKLFQYSPIAIGDGGKEPLYIIKIGGNIIDDEAKLSSFLKQFADFNTPLQGLPARQAGMETCKKILVHGGGKLATRFAQKLGIEQQLIDGRRITDAQTLKIVTMVYAGYINKNIVAALQANHCNAMGLCGADGDAILAHKRQHPILDYGFVGDVDAINTGLLKNLLKQNIAIVFAPITHNQQGQLLNTNADTMAQEIARAMSHLYDVDLIYCFEKAGVLLDVNDESTIIKKLDWKYYQQLKTASNSPSQDGGKIFAGMIPKLDNAFTAINSGVKKVVIGKAENLQQLIAGTCGTTITNE